MAKGRIGGSVKKKIGAVVYGDPFTGKSTFASQFLFMHNEDGSPMKVLYIDCESGSIDYYLDDIEAKGGNVEELYIVYTQSLSEVLNLIEKVKNHEEFYVIGDDGEETNELLLDKHGNPWSPDALVIDGITVLSSTMKQGLVEFSKKRARVRADAEGLIGDARLVKVEGAGMELKDFNSAKFKQNNLILSLIASGVHWICTSREASEKIYEKDSEGKQISVETGKKIPEGFGKDCIFNAHTVIRFTRDEYGDVIGICEKDRSGVHPGETITNPQLTDWQVIIDKSVGKKDFVIQNDLASAVETENRLYTNEIMNSMGSGINSFSKSNSPSDIVADINAAMKAMTQEERNAKKNSLTAASLPATPSEIKKIADIDTLNKILDIVKS